MKPIAFLEQTKTLSKPESMTDEECSSLPVHNDGHTCISCWRADSFIERVKFLFSGIIWLGVLSGTTQPPVYLTVDKPLNKQIK